MMSDERFNFILWDRIEKIKQINDLLDLEHNSYFSCSFGLDSMVAITLLDLALPNNKIPRVYANTGIEYIDMVRFAKECQKKDDRIIIINQVRNIKKTLQQYGYPFKSKEHSLRVQQFNIGSNANYIINKYLNLDNTSKFKCPKKLLYQFDIRGKYNYSNLCCYKLKKELLHNWAKVNNKKITITGMRNEEGGNRVRLGCLTKNNTMFHPLIVVSEEWEKEFIKRFNVPLCRLYLPPFNFKRTGCNSCPFSLTLQEQLNKLYKLLPNEYYRAINLWQYVYDEYIRIGYRLKYYPHEVGVQYDIYDFIEN